jgi:hypothetical protein
VQPEVTAVFVAAGAASGWLLSRAIRLLLISHDRIRYLLDE